MIIKIKAKISAVWVQFKKLKKLDMKPRNEQDYYEIGNWLVSRRLAFVAVLVVGILCFCFLASMSPDNLTKGTSYKTYRYNALPLKFMNGEVEILGKSGYRAYLGKVTKGAAEGEGVLSRFDGSVVYEGEFSKNYFEGSGKEYFENGNVKYVGSFCKNTFEGEGTLYREDSSKEYVGNFLDGRKEGAGKLYDSSSNPIYEGTFRKDEILYLELLGKTVEEASNIYTGRKDIYENKEEYCVDMKDISALYMSRNAEDTVEGEWIVNGVYVLHNEFPAQGGKINKIHQLQQYFEYCDYEGNTALTMADAVAINSACKEKKIIHGPVNLKTAKVFEDVMEVGEIDPNYLVYIYRFQKQGIRYTFFTADKNNEFDMYLIEKDK